VVVAVAVAVVLVKMHLFPALATVLYRAPVVVVVELAFSAKVQMEQAALVVVMALHKRRGLGAAVVAAVVTAVVLQVVHPQVEMVALMAQVQGRDRAAVEAYTPM
jgi:hypothetical protein